MGFFRGLGRGVQVLIGIAALVVVVLIIGFAINAFRSTNANADGTTTARVAPPAAPAPAPAPAGTNPDGGTPPSGSGTVSGTTTFSLLDGRSYEARTTNVDSTLGFQPYQDTGIGKYKSWQFKVPSGYTALVFGVITVDNKTGVKHDKGWMKAYVGPADVDVSVTDGAYSVSKNEATCGEAQVRIKQHWDNHWLLESAELPNGCQPPAR